MSYHIHAEQVKGPIVETEIASHAVEGLARCDHGWTFAVTLYRAPVEIECAEIQIGVVARPGRARRLNFVAAGRIFLQVETVRDAGVDVLETGIGKDPY